MKLVTSKTTGKLFITRRQAVEIVQLFTAVIAGTDDLCPTGDDMERQIVLRIDPDALVNSVTMEEDASINSPTKIYFTFSKLAARDLIASIFNAFTFSHEVIAWGRYVMREVDDPLYLQVFFEK